MNGRAAGQRGLSGKWCVVLALTLGVAAFVIWSFSLESAADSARRSSAAYRLVEAAVNRFNLLRRALDVANITTYQLQEHFRKIAHFVEYAGFGFIAQAAFAAMGRMNGHFAVHGLSAGLAVAVVDESLQTMARDRGPMVQDVLLDFAGVLFGSFIMWALFGLWRLLKRIAVKQ